MFANKVVLITGGSAGIGAATAEGFAKEKASIVIVGRNEAKLKDVAVRCEKLGAKVLALRGDVSNNENVRDIIKHTIYKFGKLDVLVNNAGILRMATVLDSNVLNVYDEILNTNLRSTVLLTYLAAPYLKETKGNIINVSSVSAMKVQMPGIGIYCMSKSGMDQFTKSSALELGPFGIRVNSVNPGPTETDMITDLQKNGDLSKFTALGRISKADEVADLIVFTASDKARGITGSTNVIDNGSLIK